MKKIPEFDILRSLCILEIIAFWHIRDYYFFDSDIYIIGPILTTIALTGFTFISGVLNSYKGYCLEYYKKRAQRLYIPFLISYFLLVIVKINVFSIKNFLLGCTGLSCFWGPQMRTLWFIAMLIWFYAVTPFCMQGKKLARIVLVFTLLTLLCYITKGDKRIILYFPIYALGLLSNKDFIVKKSNASMMLFGCVFIGVGAFINKYSLSQIIIEIGALPILLYISKLFSIISIINVIGSKIAYASMFAYLFHRFFYYYFVKYLSAVPHILVILMMVSFTLIISYFCQFIYDKLLAKTQQCHLYII